ncbi:MAG: DUF455 domain-containing protein, partial [Bdellovibrionaceae bacterium]|nr:DUF455 domain-containing protein [Pseudobdellovibrionaceae bacterium]
MNVFLEPNCDEKLKGLELHIEAVMSGKKLVIPDFSAREVLVLDLKLHPPKKGLSFKDGQARLLHDLASIELQ